MMLLLAIAAGGAIGALLRYGVSNGSAVLWGSGFAYGTLIANVTGCLLIGLFYSMYQDRMVSPETRALIQVGLLGAFTTFSTFSLETLRYLEQGEVFKAGINIVLSLTLCLLATWAGMRLGRNI